MRLKHVLKTSLEFGLPMLLTGLAFWVVNGWLTQRVLSQADRAFTQIDTTGTNAVNVSFMVEVLSLEAEINLRSNVTWVQVQVGGSSLHRLEFEYPLTAYADIERAIAQDLNLPPSTVSKLIRYRLD